MRRGAGSWALAALASGLPLGACDGGEPVDEVPPELVSAEVTPSIAGPVGTVRVIFETSEPLAAAEVSLEVGTETVALHQVEGDGTYWIFSLQLSGDEPEGEALVVADLTDEHGVVAAGVGLGRITLDFTAPQLVAAEVGTPWVRAGSRAVLAVVASEPLAPQSRAAFVAPGTDLDGVELVSAFAPGSLPSWGYTVTGAEPEGPTQLHIFLVDVAGNTGDAGVVEGFSFDFTAPALDAGSPPSVGPAAASLAAGDRVTATLTATEALSRVDATLRPAGGGFGTPMASSTDDDLSWTLERAVGAYAPFAPGTWEVTAAILDPAGHRVEVVLGTLELVD